MTKKYAIRALYLGLLLLYSSCSAPSAEAEKSPASDDRRAADAASPKLVSQEASLHQNPSEIRASATPKSLEDVSGLSGYEEVRSKSQPPSSFESREAGKVLYLRTCSKCHSQDGAPKDTGGGLARYNMAHLGRPLQFKYGADGRGIYRSIAFGTAAPPHGLYKGVYSEQQIWEIVAFVETLRQAP